MFALNGKTALITGASGGIGQALARCFAKAGAKVALAGTRTAVLKELAGELGSGAHALTSDLARPDGAAQLAQAAAEALGGRVDILVNNAGVTRDKLALRLSDEDWNEVMDLNLGAAFRLARALLRDMMKARWGRIISVTSVVGVVGQGGQSNYAASKAGLIGMSKSLAQEVASRAITVNCIAPGFITTPMTDALDEKRQAEIGAAIPLGRFGSGDDVAAAALYLASEEAGYVTGQTLHVNGGLAMV